MPSTAEQNSARLLPLMEDALKSSYGIEIETDKVAVFRRNFYRERERNSERFGCLGLLTPPKDAKHKVWIIRTSQLQGKGSDKETVNGTTDL